jgi:hypothetical protein
MNKLRNRNVRDFGWEIAHAAVSRRPPISLYTLVPRTESNAYDVEDLSLVQGPFSVAPCQTLNVTRFATLSSSLYHLRLASPPRARLVQHAQLAEVHPQQVHPVPPATTRR